MTQIARCAAAAAAVAFLAGCAAHPVVGTHAQVTDSTAATPTLTLGTRSLSPVPSREPTSTALTLPSAWVVYGHQRAERLRVTVTPRYPWNETPGGKVTIKAGQTTVCTITLASGKGSCALTATKLPVGTHTLAAVYRGFRYFTTSTSPEKTLTVVK